MCPSCCKVREIQALNSIWINKSSSQLKTLCKVFQNFSQKKVLISWLLFVIPFARNGVSMAPTHNVCLFRSIFFLYVLLPMPLEALRIKLACFKVENVVSVTFLWFGREKVLLLISKLNVLYGMDGGTKEGFQKKQQQKS